MKKTAQKLSLGTKLPFPVFFLGLLSAIFALFAFNFFFQNESLKKQLEVKTGEMAQVNSQIGQAQTEANEASLLQNKNFALVALLIINRIEVRLTNIYLFLTPNEPIVNQAREAEIKALLTENRDILGVFTDLPDEAEKLRGQMFTLESELVSFLPQLEDLTKIDLEKEQKNKTLLYQKAIRLFNQKDQIKEELIRLGGNRAGIEVILPPALPTSFPNSSGFTTCQ